MPNYKEVLKELAIPNTRFEKIYTTITAIVVALIILFIIAVWSKVPATIPTHYDALGRMDSEGSKWTILVFPIIAIPLYSLLNFFAKHPEWGNYPARINENNAAAMYLANRQLLRMLQCGTTLLLFLIALEMILVGLDWKNTVGIWSYTILIIVLIFIPMLISIFKIRKIK